MPQKQQAAPGPSTACKVPRMPRGCLIMAVSPGPLERVQVDRSVPFLAEGCIHGRRRRRPRPTFRG